MYAVFIKEEPSSPFPYPIFFPPFPYPILFFQPQGTILKGYGSVFSISIPIPILSQTPPPYISFWRRADIHPYLEVTQRGNPESQTHKQI